MDWQIEPQTIDRRAQAADETLFGRPLLRLVDPVPLFAEQHRGFTQVARAGERRRLVSGVELDVELSAGGSATLVVEGTRSGAIHVGWRCSQRAVPPVSLADGMLAEGAEPAATEVSEVAGGLVLATRQATLRLDLASLAWRLEDSSGAELTRQRVDDRNFTSYAAFPLGTTAGPGVRTWSYESLSLEDGERLYGLGQDYLGLQKRGRRTVLYNRDAFGLNGTPLTYHGTPVLWSSRGWGIVLHTGGRALFEAGHPSHDTLTVAAEGETLDFYLFTGGTPRGLIRSFYELAGAPPPIETWALGAWMSRCMYGSAEQVRGVVRRLDEIGFPFDVIHLDPAWMKRHQPNFRGEHGTDFEWGAGAFGPAAQFFDELRRSGLRVSLWQNPYALIDSTAWTDLEAVGGIARSGSEPAWATEAPQVAAVVDFTNSSAAKWWSDRCVELLEAGAACFKTDFGEGVPDEARFQDGRDGAAIHNLYALLYNRLVFEATRVAGAERPLVFGRSGWLGSHRYPVQWSGDARSTFGDMRGALRAGLSAALTGTAYWASDIGGFYAPGFTPTDPELYGRWSQLGAVSAVARFHGTAPREPYEFSAGAADVAVQAMRLRYRLLPYLVGSMPSGGADSLPMMRPLLVDWPADHRVQDEATEFMLGDDLLAAPVLSAGGTRTVYLPAGGWHDWWTGRRYEGPVELQVDSAGHRFPLFQREGTTIELGRGRRVAEVLAGPVEQKHAADPYAE